VNNLPSLWPGEVESYDAAARTCKVRIPGITDGSSDLPEAVFNNALGDRASDTEVRILAGDLVWLMFEGGDPRYPIIMGYRTPRAGNPTDWRRWRHANIEFTADGVFKINAASFEVNADTTTINSPTTVNGATGINGDTTVTGGLSNNGKSVGSTHTHPNGTPNTGVPN
jgi:phage baseplate assembly protein gpV